MDFLPALMELFYALRRPKETRADEWDMTEDKEAERGHLMSLY